MGKRNKTNKFKQINGGNNGNDLGLQSIRIERSGFDINIGGDNYFFDTSEGHIRQYLELAEDPDAFIAKVLEKAGRTEVTDENLDLDTFDSAINDQKEALEIAIDTIVGSGSFKRLYAKYPDVLAISKIMATVMEVANKGLTAWSDKQQREADAAAAQAVIDKKRNRGQ